MFTIVKIFFSTLMLACSEEGIVFESSSELSK